MSRHAGKDSDAAASYQRLEKRGWGRRCMWIPCKPSAALPSHRMGGFNISSWLQLLLCIVWPWVGSSYPPLRLIIKQSFRCYSWNLRQLLQMWGKWQKLCHYKGFILYLQPQMSLYNSLILVCKNPLGSIFICLSCCVSNNVNLKRHTPTGGLIPFSLCTTTPAKAEHTLELSKQCSLVCCLF